MSSAKASRVIWTAEGRVKCTDARLALTVGDLFESRKAYGHTVNQGGTADIVYSSLTECVFLSGIFCFPPTVYKTLRRFYYVYTFKAMARPYMNTAN